jgi:hypothetical protein
MKLKVGASVISFLRGPVTDGRLLKDGNFWTVPAAKVAAPPAVPAAPAPVSPVLAPEVAIALIPPPASVIELPTLGCDGSGFRCAIWSDGAMELQRAGRTLATLTTIEQTQLSQFMRRIAA